MSKGKNALEGRKIVVNARGKTNEVGRKDVGLGEACEVRISV